MHAITGSPKGSFVYSSEQVLGLLRAELDFTSVEFDLLRYLLENAGNLVPREELAERVLGRRFSPFDRSIDMHVSKVRKKLGDNDTDSDEHIKTVRGVGYIFARPREKSKVI